MWSYLTLFRRLIDCGLWKSQVCRNLMALKLNNLIRSNLRVTLLAKGQTRRVYKPENVMERRGVGKGQVKCFIMKIERSEQRKVYFADSSITVLYTLLYRKVLYIAKFHVYNVYQLYIQYISRKIHRHLSRISIYLDEASQRRFVFADSNLEEFCSISRTASRLIRRRGRKFKL